MIDSHTHIYGPNFEEDYAAVIERAKKSGVKYILLPNIDIESIDQLHKSVDNNPEFCLPMMGLHPTSVDENWKKNLAVVRANLDNPKYKYVAIGEIGGDMYWNRQYEVEQKMAFEEQLRWSIEFDLPVSIHSRNCIPELIRCIKNVGVDKLRGVFHCFGGNTEELRHILELGNFKIGVNGIVTFKNSTLPMVLRETDLSNIILETDAPYLAPMPNRGKRNEPSYLPYVVTKLAEIFQTTEEEVIRTTSENSCKLFNLPS